MTLQQTRASGALALCDGCLLRPCASVFSRTGPYQPEPNEEDAIFPHTLGYCIPGRLTKDIVPVWFRMKDAAG